MINGLIAANAPREVIDKFLFDSGESDSQDFEVWSENWPVVSLFLTVGTQWNISPEGRPIGLHYPSVESAMNLKNIRKSRRSSLLNDIRLMEETALSVFRERK